MTFPFPFFVPSGSRFPVIESTMAANETGVNTATNVTMPATVNAGDLLLVILAGWNSSNAVNWTTPSGWTLLGSLVGGGTMRRLGVYYKVADGAEDGTSVNWVSSVNAFNAWVVYRITGYSGTPEVSTGTTGTSSAPDSGSLSPSWGTQDTLWISCCGVQNSTSTAQASAPSGYAALTQVAAISSGQDVPRCSSAHRLLRASSEDPGAFGTSGPGWAAYTIAIRGP